MIENLKRTYKEKVGGKIGDFVERTYYRAFGQKEIRGPINRTTESNIEIHNRSWRAILHRMFFSDASIRNHLSLRDKYFSFLNSKDNLKPSNYTYYCYNKNSFVDDVDELGLDQIFKAGNTVLDLGCGGGAAALGMASTHPDVNVLA